MIARIRAVVPPARASVVVGIGDDAAVVEPERGRLTVATTDALVEGIHFERAFCSSADVGHKALAVNLSDLAAMGAAPHHALLSLALPAACPVSDVDALLESLLALAERHRTALIGGNIAASPGPLVVSLTAVGSVARRRILTRRGARPGDILYVSGRIGAAAAGLASLRGGPHRDRPDPADCRLRYRRPEPRVRLGVALGRNRAARACIDLSDGLGDAVRQLAAASGTGARIEADALPIHPEARAWLDADGLDPVAAALQAGEDYELAFTAPPAFRGRLRHVRRMVGDLPVTPVGVMTREREVRLHRDGRDEPLPDGFEHFVPEPLGNSRKDTP